MSRKNPLPTEPSETPHSGVWRRVAKWALLLAVLSFLARHVLGLYNEWHDDNGAMQGVSVDFFWLGISCLAYLLGQICFAVFWRRLLLPLGVTAKPLDILAAYAYGTIGKYIPGKAGVVLMRSAYLRDAPDRVQVGISAVFETLTMVALGGWIAAATLLFVIPHQWWCWGGGTVIGLGVLTALHPAVFDRVARLALRTLRRSSESHAASHFAVLLRWGWLSLTGWLCLGTSFFAIGLSLGCAQWTLADFASCIGTSALAMTSGFLVLFAPSGIAVRELVIIYALGSRFGEPVMVAAALLLRTVWTATEVLLAGTIFGASRLGRTPGSERDAVIVSPGMDDATVENKFVER